MVTGINGQNLDFAKIKELLTQKAGGKFAAQQGVKVRPEMTMQGSLFNMPEIRNAQQTGATQNNWTSFGVGNNNFNVQDPNFVSTSGIGGTQGTQGAQRTATPSYLGASTPTSPSDIDIFNYDFDNLTNVPDAELQNLKTAIEDMKNDDELKANCHLSQFDYLDNCLNSVNNQITLRENPIQSNSEVSGEAATQGADGDKKAEKDEPSVDDGKNAIKAAKKGATEARQGQADAEKITEDSDKISKEMTNITNTTKQDEATFNKEVKDLEKSIDKDSKEVTKEQETLDAALTEQEQLDKEEAELEAELEAATAELNGADDVDGAADPSEVGDVAPENAGDDDGSGVTFGASAPKGAGASIDQSKIDDINARINANREKSTQNSKVITTSSGKIKTLQTRQSKNIKILTKKCKSFETAQKMSQKQIQQTQTKQEKALEKIDKIEQVADTVTTIGSTAETVGNALIAYGTALSSGTAVVTFGLSAAAGAAMISVGTVAVDVGTVAQTCGNACKCATGVAKTAIYASQGNIKGAFQAAGSAVMSGCSAAKGAKEIGSGFQGTKDKVAKSAEAAKAKAEQKAKDIEAKAADKATKLGDKATKKAAKGAEDKVQKLRQKAQEKYGYDLTRVAGENGATDTFKIGENMDMGSKLGKKADGIRNVMNGDHGISSQVTKWNGKVNQTKLASVQNFNEKVGKFGGIASNAFNTAAAYMPDRSQKSQGQQQAVAPQGRTYASSTARPQVRRQYGAYRAA